MATKRIVLFIAITALLIASAAAPALALLPNGQAAPNFQLTDLSGTSHTLSEYRGKVVVIDFFGWACGYCQDDAKNTLVPLYNSYYKNDPKVQFLGVEIDGGSVSEDQGFAQETGVSWPILMAGSSNVASAYEIASTPTVYVISPAGTVASSSVYPTNAATLKSTIDALEGTSTPVASAPVHVFVQGTDQALWSKYYQSGTGWSRWQSLGGVLTSSPAATSPGNGLIDVFARGSDGALWSRSTTNNGTTWSNWTSLGGQIPTGTGPAACSSGAGRLDLFVQGTDGGLYQKTWDGTSWSSWQSLGGVLTSSPAATSPGNGLIDVFARGSDGALWYKDWNGAAWSGWYSLGGQIPTGTGPAACSSGSGLLDVFVQGTNGALYQKTWDGTSWSSWQSLGGSVTSSPAAASPGSGPMDVFARGSDDALWYKDWNGAAWSSWYSLGGQIPTGTGPAACS
jgi:peroxiredoxin